MDPESVGAAIAIMKQMPNNAADSASAAAASAEEAKKAANSVTTATDQEIKTALGIS
jgi:hypothetical protein